MRARACGIDSNRALSVIKTVDLPEAIQTEEVKGRRFQDEFGFVSYYVIQIRYLGQIQGYPVKF